MNRSLTPVEQDWVQGILRSAKVKAPTQIGDWHLSDASAAFNPGKAPSWGREYFGVCLRFEYRDSGGREAIVYHFINPVRIHYPEVGWGYYLGFFSYHNKRDSILDTPTLRILLNGGRLPLESPMVSDADKELVNNRSMVKVCCYRGKGWTRSEQQDHNEAGNIFVDMGLQFRETQWKSEVYGDLCIAVIPRDQAVKEFVLHYLGAD